MTVNRHARRWKTLTALVGVGLALPGLLACGADAAPAGTDTAAAGKPAGGSAAQPADGSAAQPGEGKSIHEQSVEMRRKEEELIAACMRRSGFTYKAHVPAQFRNDIPQPETYEGLKEYRTKYGFGHMFAAIVYQGDPKVIDYFEDDPNQAIKEKLDPIQRKSYDTALHGPDQGKRLKLNGGCIGEAVKAVDPRARKEREQQIASIEAGETCDQRCQAHKQAINRLKPQEAEYAQCLKAKGYGVAGGPGGGGSTVQVTDIADRVVGKDFDRANKAAPFSTPKVDPEAARTGLRNEIKVALEDLECGKTYLPALTKATREAFDTGRPTGGLS